MEKLRAKPLKRLKQLLTVGNLWLYIISFIKRNGKSYAYALDDEIEKRYFFKPSKVMIYLVLYKLEAEGLIESKFEERRKYYTLTKKGEETLELAKEYFTILGKEL
ncbi:PadR family transcriptional regulator [Candidatus Micrarchaeota archaeon]|nr:PadR family transcriptional regulator [Candidatus Micrarchaeota archaeon]